MLSFQQSFDKSETSTVDRRTRRRVTTMVPVYSAEQLAALGIALEVMLSTAFVTFETQDLFAEQLTKVTYHGNMVEGIETDRNAEIDVVYNAWFAEQGG